MIGLLLLSFLPEGYSQDWIFTFNKDTIDCKITKISNTTVFFEVTTKGIKSYGELPLKSILNYTISGKETPERQVKTNPEPFKRLRFGINGGPGILLGSTEVAEDNMESLGLPHDQAESYYNDMITGWFAGADLNYLFTLKYGAGIKYKIFETSGSIEGFFDPLDGINLFYTTYSEHIYVNYIGLSLFYHQWIGKKERFKVTSEFSSGLATYRNEAEYLNSFLLLTGKNFGLDIGLGLEYHINRFLSVGAEISTFYSSIRKIKVSDGSNSSTVKLDKDNYENLSRLDLSVGIRLYLWNR